MKKGHKILILKRYVVILSTILIALISSLILYNSSSKKIIANETTSLKNAADAVSHQYDTSIERDTLYTQYSRETLANVAGYMAYSISKNGYTTSTTNDLSSELSKIVDGYYFKGNVDYDEHLVEGSFYSPYSSYKKLVPSLDNEEVCTLFEDGFLQKGDIYYSSYKINSSEFVITYSSFTDFIIRPNIISTYSSGLKSTIILIDSESGLIKDSNTEGLIGSDFSDLISEDELNKVADNKVRRIRLKNGAPTIVCVSQSSIDDSLICAYLPLKNLIPIYIRTLFIPIILTTAFLIFIMLYMLGFMKPHLDTEKERIEYFHFCKNIYSDSKLLSHNLGLGMLSIIMVIFSTAYVQTLVNHSTESINNSNNIKALETFIDASEQNWEAIKEDMLMTNTYIGDILADYYLKHPEEVNNKDVTVMCNSLPYMYELTILDNTATIVADTSNRNGYTLSADETSPENVFQNVLHGSLNSTYYIEDYYYYTITRRQDKVGLIRYANYSYYYDQFKDNCSIDSDLRSIDFQTSTKGYIAKKDLGEIYWISPTDNLSENIHHAANTLTEENLFSKSCVTTLDGKKEIFNISEMNNYYIFSATDVSILNGLYNIAINLTIVIAFILQQTIIFFTNLRKKDEVPKKQISFARQPLSEDDIYAKMMDTDFRKIFTLILSSTLVTVVILIIEDSVIENTSLISYIVDSQWPKGINLFSLTMILVSTIGTFLISKLLRSLLIFFTHNMGPRGLTIGKMLSSIISFLALIITIILAVVFLGVNYTALLAGAGIAGVALTVCAQSSISDMLSGFLIVFENLFNIGDWLTVGDFRGQVTEIGLRTTKLQISKTVKIFNNSELKNVTVMERNGQGCVVLVDIAYKEDANKVIDLLRNSTERYQADIPAIVEGPYIDGIVNLSSSGVTLYIWAIAELEMIRATEREIRRVTKNIFDENHIEIPFTQITLHEADVERYFTGEDEE